MINVPQGQLCITIAAKILSGQQASSAIDLNGLTLVGILLPAAFTGTALTFKASIDGVNWFTLKTGTGGTTLSYTVAQGTYAAIDPKDFYGVAFLQVVSGSAEGADRALNIAARGF